jgi:hypothetical protein
MAGPDDRNAYRLERSIGIAAPADRIFASLVDFRRWTEWSPWEGLDPAMQRLGIFTSMDKIVGRDFEKGLAQLKTVAEG